MGWGGFLKTEKLGLKIKKYVYQSDYSVPHMAGFYNSKLVRN